MRRVRTGFGNIACVSHEFLQNVAFNDSKLLHGFQLCTMNGERIFVDKRDDSQTFDFWKELLMFPVFNDLKQMLL